MQSGRSCRGRFTDTPQHNLEPPLLRAVRGQMLTSLARGFVGDVANIDAPAPLRIVNHGKTPGSLTFTDYGHQIPITARPGAEPVQTALSAVPTATSTA